MNEPTPLRSWTETPFVKGAAILLLTYWALYACVVPVTVWDAQTYNLARLKIAWFGGLFGNKAWNEERQVAFPWGFDAVHLPFLFLGWGYALPSFACFAGVMLIVFRMVREMFGERSAWYCCLAMLALPTLVFQATSTKNDMAVLFGVSCWVYALWRIRSNRSAGLLFLAALALGFATGAKSTGVPLLVLLASATIWRLRHDRQSVRCFLLFLLPCVILFGSVEIYVNNWLTYGHPLGPEHMQRHQNHDGIRGMLANFIRYTIGSINLGIDVANPKSPFPAKLADLCRAVLSITGLENKGYRWDFNDSNMQFLKIGWEAASDFGPLGTLSLATAGFVFLTRPGKDVLWRMTLAGFAWILLVSVTTAWMPWNMRFLLLSFVLFALVTAILLTSDAAQGWLGRLFLLVVCLFSAVAFPWYSLNKGPKDLWSSVADRSAMSTKEHPTMLEILRDLGARTAEIGRAPVLLYGAGNAAVLPVLQLRDLRVIPSPQIDESHLRRVSSENGGRALYILTLNQPLIPECHATLVKKYQEPDSALYSWPAREPLAVADSRGAKRPTLSFTFVSGWDKVEQNGADWLRWTDGRGLIRIDVPTNTVAALTGQILSAQRPNDVDVVLNSQTIASLRVDWTKWEFRDFHPVTLPLKAGENSIEFVSHNPPISLKTGGRLIAVAVQNLSVTGTERD